MSTVGRSDVTGGQQFYVTHCTTSDSVLNSPGYSVRAASAVDDPGVIRRALEYPPYEIPLEMWKQRSPTFQQAPRRLACTQDIAGGVWVVQSVFCAKDTMGRDRSYFSHLLRLNTADPAAVLQSWGADRWVTDYPRGANKVLPNPELPLGNLVSDESVTAFLSSQPPSQTDLGIAVCPTRLRRSVADRRDLFARMLYALVLSAGEEGRRRIYVHAEPGMVALLLYGAVRLLPSTTTNGLTFSTYEPSHRNLRDYDLAEVVGTYTGDPESGLDPILATQGIVLDTFTPTLSSPALGGWVPRNLLGLIDLAAAGQWAIIQRPDVAPSPIVYQEIDLLPTESSDEPRTYSAQITRTNPACLLLLIDQSGSMSELFAGGVGQSKATVVADAVNRLLQNVVLRSAKADGVRDYFRVGVIGYGKEIKAGLGGSIPFDILIPISRLGAYPLRVETRSKLMSNGLGGLIAQPVRFPVWFDPETGGKTPMCEALATAGLAVKGFIEEFPDAYPPIVLNLTDGIPSDGNPQENARKIRNLATSDGPVLLFNLLISSKPVPAEYFPASEEMFADNFSKLLFRMSSELPPKLRAAAEVEGHILQPGARGVVLNADPTAIVRFLDIGTRINHPSTDE